MRKYKTSNDAFQKGNCIILSLSGLVCIAFLLNGEVSDSAHIYLQFTIAAIVLFEVLVLGVFFRKMFFDPIWGQFCFDEKGIDLWAKARHIHYYWNEVVDMGFVLSRANRNDMACFVYCSKVHLSDEQINLISTQRSTKKRGRHNLPLYLKEFVLFEYSPKTFPLFLNCIPVKFREQLMANQNQR